MQKQHWAHLCRRTIHFLMVFLPWIYYWYGNNIAEVIGLSRDVIVLILLLVVLILEAIRLKNGWLIFGQRSYESKQFSALAWSAIAISITLLLAPKIGYNEAALGFPLIASMAIVDPILGELRRREFSYKFQFCLGYMILILIWLIGHLLLSTPLVYLFILPPIILLSEFPRLSWIDDNALMLLAPLIIIFLVNYFA